MPIYEYQCGKCGHCFEQIQTVGAGGRERIQDRLSPVRRFENRKGALHLFLRRGRQGN